MEQTVTIIGATHSYRWPLKLIKKLAIRGFEGELILIFYRKGNTPGHIERNEELSFKLFQETREQFSLKILQFHRIRNRKALLQALRTASEMAQGEKLLYLP